MAMSEKVEESLKEAARTEKPMVTSSIADVISRIDGLIGTHKMLDKFEDMAGKSGFKLF